VSPLLAELSAAWPRELLGVALVACDEIDSTQRLARTLLDRHLADDEELPRCCVLALAQSAGRGRRGREWQSAPGLGVWATVVVPVAPASLASVPLRTATALAETLAHEVPGVRLKWPNDLVVEGRKLGGLLVETVARDGERAWALIGFGVNLGHAVGDLPTPLATSLRLLGVAENELSPATWAPRLVAALMLEHEQERGDWLERYRARSAHRPGDRIECDLEGERIAGEFVALDAHGALRLRCADGERTITSGDVYAW
jgi:BirA family transcriptional regulator, biotin operon repressor / biotin---[acetyl-CoA-carboxylase] ligase